MAVNTFFFDLGGVLINFSLEKMSQNIADLCHLDLELVKVHLFEKNLAEMYERGVIDSKTLYDHFCQLSSQTFSFELLMESVANIFSLKEEMPPLLESLKRQNMRLFLLSNTCEAHIEYVKNHFEFLNLFDGLVLSYEQVCRKPEKEIFDAALAMAECPADACFYTDDIEPYVQAASSFGIDGHHFTGKQGLVAALSQRGIDV